MEHYTMNKAETEHANATGARIVKILPTETYNPANDTQALTIRKLCKRCETPTHPMSTLCDKCATAGLIRNALLNLEDTRATIVQARRREAELLQELTELNETLRGLI
jgi:hypothetical protein